jgi:hypothetical protein
MLSHFLLSYNTQPFSIVTALTIFRLLQGLVIPRYYSVHSFFDCYIAQSFFIAIVYSHFLIAVVLIHSSLIQCSVIPHCYSAQPFMLSYFLLL